MMEILKKLLKFGAYVFVILFVLGLLIGGVIYLTSPPSYAGFNDKVILDIGQDGYMIATIDDALEYKNEKIPDGEVKVSSNTVLKWKDARNVSFVDTVGKKCYAIVWKASINDMDFEVKDSSKVSYDYGDIFGVNSMYAIYCLKYNPQNKMVYGIILDNNHHNYDLNDLLYKILNLNRSDVNYHEYYPSSGSSSHYGVDTSPSTIARNDPDWYYDHYEYGDNPKIDDYLESQGYD